MDSIRHFSQNVKDHPRDAALACLTGLAIALVGCRTEPTNNCYGYQGIYIPTDPRQKPTPILVQHNVCVEELARKKCPVVTSLDDIPGQTGGGRFVSNCVIYSRPIKGWAGAIQ